MIRTGVIGHSENNGHPFSFSAIINGYDDSKMRESGWAPIADYLSLVPKAELGIQNAFVTHVWTQDYKITKAISETCNVRITCSSPEDMLDNVDAIIIARDDWRSHYELAKIFLDEGLPVFIDKPLTLDLIELEYFSKYLETGKLMSCSGLRFATELDGIKLSLAETNFVSATVLNDFPKYGVHLLESLTAINAIFSKPITIMRLPLSFESFLFSYKNGVSLQLNCLGPNCKTFQLDFYGKTKNNHITISDNFTAFKRTLSKFFEMIDTKKPTVDPNQTRDLMRLMIAVNDLAVGEEVNFEELEIQKQFGFK